MLLDSIEERNAFVDNLNKELDDLLSCSSTETEERIIGIRKRYSELLTAFPSMSTCWYSWIQFEQRSSSPTSVVEDILRRCIDVHATGGHGDITMWRIYVEHFRRLVPLELSDDNGSIATQEETEVAINKQRLAVIDLFERALSEVGLEINAGPLYWDYITYIESWNAHTMYEKQLQMEQLRKIFHRTISTPLRDVELFWTHWEQWEQGLNRLTAKKLISERSPPYMAARAAMIEFKALVVQLPKDVFAMMSSTGNTTGTERAYRRWLEWEIGNPLGLPPNGQLLFQRINLVFRSAILTGPLYRSGPLWYKWFKYLEGLSRTTGGPSVVSCDLAFETIKRASLEVLPQNPSLCIAMAEYLEERQGADDVSAVVLHKGSDSTPSTPRDVYENFIANYKEDGKESLSLLFINYMSYERRSVGLGAARALFTKARKMPPSMGACNPSVFAEAARQEYCNATPTERHKHLTVAMKIMELGMNRFSADNDYVAGYLSFLLDKCCDEANASALFERSIDQIGRSALLVEDPSELIYGSLKIWRLMIRWSWDNWTPQARDVLLERFRDVFSKNPSVNTDDFALWADGKRLVGNDVDFWCGRRSYDGYNGYNGYNSYNSNDGYNGNSPNTILENKNNEKNNENGNNSNDKLPFCISTELMSFISRLPTKESYSSVLVPSKGLIDLLSKVAIPHNFGFESSCAGDANVNDNTAGTASQSSRKRSARQVSMEPVALGRGSASASSSASSTVRRKTTREHRDFDPSAPRERENTGYGRQAERGSEDIFAHRRR